MRASQNRKDDGSALIIALVFVTVFGLIVAGLLSFSEVGLRAAASAKSNRERSSVGGGAVDAAINRFRRGGPCDDYTAPVGPGGQPLYGQGVIVRCVDDNRPASGRATRPVNALLSRGSEGVSTYPGFEQRVVGDVFSNSTVTAGAPLSVQGKVSATGNCNGTIRTTPETDPPTPSRCANTGGGADPAQGRDPDFTKAMSAVPIRRKAPTCSADPAVWLVELLPGYYDDATALSAVTNGTDPDCQGKVVWLQPGNYYLDFTFRGGPGTWTIDDPSVTVVGGTPRNWSSSLPSPPTAAELAVPGSCRTEAGSEGVQLVAGGGTHIEVTRGRAELCAEPSSTDQSTALYGIGPDRPTHSLEPNDWKGVVGFTNPGGATTIAEAPVAAATATLAAGTADAGSITLTTFRPGIPDGSLVDSATLRIVHREDGDMDDASKSVKVAAAFSGNTCTAAEAVPVSVGTYAERRVDLKACGLTGPRSFADLEITYTAALRAGGSTAVEDLDGMAVEVAYRVPSTGKPTSVLSATGFGNPDNAKEIGEQPAPPTSDAALSATGLTTASITLGGLGDPPIPAGSTIDSAVLRVAHRDRGDIKPPTVTVPFPGGSCTGKALPLRDGAAIVDDRVDLKACGLDDAAELLGLTATYDVSLTDQGFAATAGLDGMWLELVYRPPALSQAPPAIRRPATALPTAPGFAPLDAARVIDGALSVATVANGGAPAAVTVSGYGDVPPGSAIDSARLRLAHREDAWAPVTWAATFPESTCAGPQALTSSPDAIEPSTVDLIARCGLTKAEQLAGLAATYTANPPATAVTTQVPGATSAAAAFDVPDKARATDGVTADAGLSELGATSASVTLSGYNVPAPPAGSTIDKALLHVSHQEEVGIGPATITFAGVPCGPKTFDAPRPDLFDDTIDLKACGLDNTSELDALTVTYATSLTAGSAPATARVDGIVLDLTYRPPPATARLDGIELDIVFRPPSFRPLSGCAVVEPYPLAAGSCALLKVAPLAGDTTTRFVAQGTVYAPSAALDISMAGLSDQVLTRGLVGRTIRLGLRAAPGYKRPVIGVPPEPVRFTAYPDVRATADLATSDAPGFDPPGEAKAIDGVTSKAALSPSLPTSASLKLSGFTQTATPPVAAIDAAVLRVVHREDVDIGSVAVEVAFPDRDETRCPQPFQLSLYPSLAATPGQLGEDQIDLTQCGLNNAAQLAALRVTYTATVGGAPSSAYLDGVSLDVLSGPLVQARVAFDATHDKVDVVGWSVLR